MNGHKLQNAVHDLEPMGQRLIVETVDGEIVSGLFDGLFSIDSQPELGATGIQIVYQTDDSRMPKARYFPASDVADVYLDEPDGGWCCHCGVAGHTDEDDHS